jgi:glycosyltransferase involved in cell wall biosynthesis
VYAGGVTAARGLATAVAALPELPAVHLAVIAVPHSQIPAARNLVDQAAELGVSSRLHLLDPVPPEQVSAFVSGADVGLLPLLHFGSHEVALPNKLFEYLYGGVPVLVSDCRAQAEFVRRHRVGRVHTAGDAASLAAELRALLGESATLRARIAAAASDLLVPFAWDRQEESLREVYRRLLGADRVREPSRRTDVASLREEPVRRRDRPSVLGVGPANMAGQGWAWARAAERVVPGLRAEVVAVDRGSAMVFEADRVVPAQTYARDTAWAREFEAHALATWTHALLEAGRPVFGLQHGRDFTGDAAVLRAVGIDVGLVLHGSEIRCPRRHAQAHPWSPFRDPGAELTARLQRQWDVLHPLVMAFDGPVFVSTPDLLDDVPHAHLLPVVVDVDGWASSAPVMEREVPVVVHAPSRAALKGSDHVDHALTALVGEGLVEYQRLDAVPREQVREAIRGADIVVDQFGIGTYGVLAVEALAAGRVVVAHVAERYREAFGGEVPIVEATPDHLADVLRGLVADRAAAAAAAASGPGYAAKVHDGRHSGAVLRDVLGLRGGSPS